MKNHFIFSYFGNKRNEVQTLYNLIKDDLINKTTIIEPFCGSSALSYYLSTQHPKKYNYVLNDNSTYLIEVYKILQDEEKTEDFIKKLNDMHTAIIKEKTPEERKTKYLSCINENNVISWVYSYKLFCIRPGLYPIKYEKRYINYNFNDILKAPIINFLRTENIKFTNDCGVNCFNSYKDDENNFIFLDPPYLQTCNDFYQDRNVNIYEYLYKNNITNMKSKIILILENIWIIKLLFNSNKIIQTNNKTYQASKKKTSHLTISN